MSKSNFHKGVFPCDTCGRQTRGQSDVVGIDMCAQCYYLAGDDNMHNDDGTTPDAEQMAHYEALLAEIVEKGGDAEKVKGLNDYLWTEPPLKFDRGFGDGGGYVYAFDTLEVEHDGYTFTARIEFDQDSSIDDDDMHNVDPSVTGCTEEEQARVIAAREAYERDEWFYCGVVIAVSKAGIELDTHAASLWGVECNYPDSDNSYLTDVANELLEEALEVGREAVYKLTRV